MKKMDVRQLGKAMLPLTLVALTACSGGGAESASTPSTQVPTPPPSSASSSSSSTGLPSSGLDEWGNVRVPVGSVEAPPVAIRRLNRAEYNNTVRDLFYTDLRPAERFPEDDFGHGFNNIARVLSVSLTHLEQYQSAAERLVEEAIARASDSDRRVIPCNMDAGLSCARETAETFGARAWRRPLSPEEIEKQVGTYQAGLSIANQVTDGMNAMMQSILLSPHFIFRSEVDPDLSAREAYPLDAYSLASRVSYFIWGSMPDQALFDAAANGSLSDDATLRVHVRRMLADARASNMIDQFAVQWLKFDTVEEASPDPVLYPGFTETLMLAMRQETRLFVEDWFENNGRISDLVTATHTFLNGELAAHYGVGTISGDAFVRHEWEDERRFGLLGQASVLTATSHPTRTSPVRRGKWFLENLACKSPPPPPPGVENLGEDASAEGLTTREKFELHRDASSVCFACHSLMDPIGFGLEHFDAVGRWRAFEGGAEIDATGSLPGGYDFSGATELVGILGDSAELPLCATKHLLTFALGRGIDALDPYAGEDGLDDPLVYQVYLNTLANGHRIHDLIEEVVLSKAFRNRFGAEATGEISL